jgi:hypothetical protein
MGMLGPTDPKVMNEFNPIENGQRVGINVEDVFSYISLVKEDVGITHEDELVAAWSHMAGEGRVHPLALGNVKRFYAQSRMMAKKLLELHMGRDNEHKVKDIADSLNSKLYFHGHPINLTEAQELGLKAESISSEFQKAVWDLYLDYERDLKLETQFKPDMELKSRQPIYPMLDGQIQPVKVDLEEDVTCIESDKRSHILRVGFSIEGYKASSPNGGIQEFTNLTQTKELWVETPAPAPKAKKVA